MKKALLTVLAVTVACGIAVAQDATDSGAKTIDLHLNNGTIANPYYSFDGKDYHLNLLGNGFLPLLNAMEHSATLDKSLQQQIDSYREATSTGKDILLAGALLAAGGAGYMYYATFSNGGAIGVFSGLGAGIIGVIVGLVGENWAGEPTKIVDGYNATIAGGGT